MDICLGKVKNIWLLLGGFLGVWSRGWSFVLPAIVVMIPSFFLWNRRMMGAGDGKLMAVIAGYLGFFQGITAIWFGFCIGAVWSFYRLWKHPGLLRRFSYLHIYFLNGIYQKNIEKYDDWTDKTGEAGHRIPLAACLAAGVYLYLFLKYFG